MRMEMRRTKRNGFGRPLHPYQYVSYFIIFYQLPVTGGLLGPLIPHPGKEVFLSFYGPLQILVLLFGFLVTKSDPTDTVVYAHRRARANNELFDTGKFDTFCTICGTSVSSSSKHCGYCNRCVSRFDHHCKWLNNCIGGLNYPYFIVLIGSLELMEIVVFSASTFILTRGFGHTDWLRQRFVDVFRADKLEVALALLLVQALLAFLVLFAIGNLIVLHLWLRKWKKMTTFEYILYLRHKHSNSSNTSVRPPTPMKEKSDEVDASGVHLLVQKCSKMARKGTQILPEDLAEVASDAG